MKHLTETVWYNLFEDQFIITHQDGNEIYATPPKLHCDDGECTDNSIALFRCEINLLKWGMAISDGWLIHLGNL